MEAPQCSLCLQSLSFKMSTALERIRISNDNSYQLIFNNNNNNNNNRVVPHRRKEARWSNTLPMAERQVFILRRDGHMPSGRIIRHWVRSRGRCCCSGTRRFSQRRKIRQHWFSTRMSICMVARLF